YILVYAVKIEINLNPALEFNHVKLIYRRTKLLIFIIASYAGVSGIQAVSPGLSFSGGVENYATVSVLLLAGLFPYFFLKTYRLRKTWSRLSEVEPRRLDNIREGFNVLRTSIKSRKPVRSPLKGGQKAFVKVTVNSMSYWSIHARRILEYTELFIGSGDRKTPLQVDESSDIELPGADSETDLISGFGTPARGLERFEKEHGVGTFFRRGYRVRSVENGQEVTLAGRFDVRNGELYLTSAEDMPILISEKNPESLEDHYGKRIRRNAAMTALSLLAVLLVAVPVDPQAFI
ncbi:MAG: hypothetical protein ABEJ03_06360, partial [Candidatus Nanohaloarchaea archaeon]